MPSEVALALNARKINVVVARDDRHLDRARDGFDHPACFSVFGLQREIREVAGDHDVIGVVPGSGEHCVEVIAPEHARATQEDVRIAGQALVEHDASPVHAGGREHVQVRYVGDPHGVTLSLSAIEVPSTACGLQAVSPNGTAMPPQRLDLPG